MTTDPQTMKDLVADLTIAQELAVREASISKINFLPTTSTHTLYCQYTGTPIASIALIHQAGRAPYLKEWQQSIVVHPLFSLSTPAILSWTRKNWNRIFRDASDHASPVERLQFQIAFVAVLRTLDSIKQECPVLPSFDTCQRHMQSLLELAYWKFYLDSQRFRFPTLRINKLNANTALDDIGAYFAVCNSVRADWETKRDALAEEAKIETARRVERLVRGSHVKAVSKKALWNWFIASISVKNKKKFELDEWKEWLADSSKLWFASDNIRLQFSFDDVQSIEDVFIQECELGTTISHTFQKELNAIRKTISEHLSMWDIDWDETNNGPSRVSADGTVQIPARPPEPGPEPHISNYRSRFDYLKALATWKMDKLNLQTWIEKYGQNEGKEQ